MVSLLAATLSLSALLLFTIQPAYTKMILPVLGGTPMIWVVSLCFFQASLLAGYGYAHLLGRFLGSRMSLVVHTAAMVSTAMTLPFGAPKDFNVGDSPYFLLVNVLISNIGVPFVLVSATAPLVQHWLACSGHRSASDPYFLYGASNFGSILALFSYPLVLEPFLPLSIQALSWSVGFLLLEALIIISGLVLILRYPPAEMLGRKAHAPRPEATLAVRVRWAWLAFVPSGFMVSFTNYITTDIAPAPFMWMIPLTLFLGSFIISFRGHVILSLDSMLVAQPLTAIAVLLSMSLVGGGSLQLVLGIASGAAALFVTAMVCHLRLYEARPAGYDLTAFYMWMSIGGVAGGVTAALVAPQIFNALHEYPLFLILGFACRPAVWSSLSAGHFLASIWPGPSLLLASFGVAAILAGGDLVVATFVLVAFLGISGALMIANRTHPLPLLAYGFGAALASISTEFLSPTLIERSFFGIHRVSLSSDGTVRLLRHGSTLHGAERIKGADGAPVHRPVPAAYFHPLGSLARGVEVARTMKANPLASLVVGIAGLGAGSMSCYSRPHETWRFYEIDPIVVQIALNQHLFTFLNKCRPLADIILGDARLTIAREQPGSFDYLVIDTFSSDAIPVHLLTREALLIYLERVAPNGLLALHVSNRHLDLHNVAAATALSLPGVSVVFVADRPSLERDAAPSDVLFISKSNSVLEPIREWKGARSITHANPSPWTDDYSNVASAIWRNYFK